MKFNFLNLPLLLSITFLLSVSFLVIYSSSQNLAILQIIFALIGILIFFLISQINYNINPVLVKGMYILIILLLIFVMILGIETRGSIRWIPLGPVNIQPSEFAKPVIILLLSGFWALNQPGWVNILKSILILLPVLFLIFRQPDLGTTLTIGAIWAGMLFATNISFKKIAILILATLVITPLIWFSLQDYQKQRITSFITPQNDPLGVGYNLIQSTIAVGSGQFFGRGLGYGTQSRLQFLPEFRTDFIFAAIGEEFGFIGSMIIIILYLFLIIVITAVSTNVIDYFGHLLVFGVCAMLLFQTFVNIGMNVGLLPITGITLPLISYGGSSLLSTFICLGLVSSVSRYRKKVDTE